jgi:hypothetical protein
VGWPGGRGGTDVNSDEKQTTLVGRVRRSYDGGIPVEDVVVGSRARAARRGRVLLQILGQHGARMRKTMRRREGLANRQMAGVERRRAARAREGACDRTRSAF